MTNKKAQSVETIRSVHRYATPLAVVLVGLGIILSPLSPLLRNGVAGLLIFSTLFNIFVVQRMKSGGDVTRLAQPRLAVNFAANCVFVYVLGLFWEPIWLLLLLTPLANAVYGDKDESLFAGVGGAVELLAINGVRWSQGEAAPWANQMVYALAILLITLMVNEASRKNNTGA